MISYISYLTPINADHYTGLSSYSYQLSFCQYAEHWMHKMENRPLRYIVAAHIATVS